MKWYYKCWINPKKLSNNNTKYVKKTAITNIYINILKLWRIATKERYHIIVLIYQEIRLIDSYKLGQTFIFCANKDMFRVLKQGCYVVHPRNACEIEKICVHYHWRYESRTCYNLCFSYICFNCLIWWLRNYTIL